MKAPIILIFLGCMAFILKCNLHNPLFGAAEYIMLALFSFLVVAGILLIDFPKSSKQ